jgi:transmembrane sensor
MQAGREPIEKADLIVRYLRGELTPEDHAALQAWVDSDVRNRALLESLENEAQLENDLDFLSSVDKTAAWQNISGKIGDREPERRLWPVFEKWKYAAAILLFGLLSYAIFEMAYNGKRSEIAVAKPTEVKNDALPGGDKATLTLADGTVVALEDINDGTVREENGIRVSKVAGQLVYEIVKSAETAPNAYNTIHTPVGGQYHIVLEDGSKVWLNSESSLRFPTVFSGEQRGVELTGEGYFEIARNTKMPFIVNSGKTRVEVLGTHFNVMAYANEAFSKTTLLEGSVKVSNGINSKIMIPGQQAVVGGQVQIQTTDTDEAVAWKNGYFQFENEDLKTIVRQLKRWYDIDIENEEQIPDKHFTAIISRNTPLSKVLKMLEMSGELDFDIEGKRITIKENK